MKTILIALLILLFCSFKKNDSVNIQYNPEYNYAIVTYTCLSEEFEEVEAIISIRDKLLEFMPTQGYYHYEKEKPTTKYKKNYVEYKVFVHFYKK